MALSRPVKIVLVAALVVVAAVVGTGAFLLWNFTQPIEESYEHEYEYRVTVDPNETLTNATLYLPAPVENGSSIVDARIENTSDGVATEVVETARGPMLAVTADRLPPKYENRSEPLPTPTGTAGETTSGATTSTAQSTRRYREPYQWVVTVSVNETIDTKTPDTGEPLLRPRENVTRTACGSGYGDATCYAFDTAVYASYDAPANATTQVAVVFAGRNTWFAGGWTGNEYEERVFVDLAGEEDGWRRVNGSARWGFGRY
ncbi:hypothetical protein [Halocalculus aciditolerans]|uniref:Uncharacterized protein n=1 Tax=Halocalculus aciditolerans TaxID=1383812 RepID=A0A830F994_9EURY|nr:hypothetical protein [Halocalculus aciditolerans]GGL52185.1 hypothetical protein GCM10009039_08110 [Halocalculus aciditolerans]